MRTTKRCVLMVAPGRVEARLLTSSGWHKPSSVVVAQNAVNYAKNYTDGGADSDATSVADANTLSEAIVTVLSGFKSEVSELTVIISDALCRALVAPRPAGTASLVELNASLEARFNKAFGEDAEDWQLTRNTPPRSSIDVVCGVPRNLVATIETAARVAHFKVISMRPMWVWCAMDSGLTSRGGVTWVVIGDGHAITAALFKGETCCGIRTVRTEAPDALQGVLARNGLLFEHSHDAKGVVLWGENVAAEKELLADDISLTRAGWPEVWHGRSTTTQRRGQA